MILIPFPDERSVYTLHIHSVYNLHTSISAPNKMLTDGLVEFAKAKCSELTPDENNAQYGMLTDICHSTRHSYDPAYVVYHRELFEFAVDNGYRVNYLDNYYHQANACVSTSPSSHDPKTPDSSAYSKSATFANDPIAAFFELASDISTEISANLGDPVKAFFEMLETSKS
jgi:hypothetical protein